MSVKFILMSVMILGLACYPACLQAEEPLPVLKGIRVFMAGPDLGVEISADKKFEYTCSKMPQLLRVVIDLPRTEPGIPDTVYRYKSAMISTIRIQKKSINDVQITRVSVDLPEDADYTIRTDSPDKTKLTLLFRKAAPGSTAETAAARPASIAQAQPAPANAAAQRAPAPAPKPASTPVMARADQSVTVTGVSCGADSIEIRSSGNISEFKAFTLQQPGRLVIDIPGAQTTLRSIAIPANGLGVLKARTGIFEGKLRLVFEAGSKPFPAYDVVKTETGLRILSRASAERK